MFMLKQKYKSLKQKGKSMKKQKNAQIIILSLLLAVVIFTTVGFAAYTQNLNIGGTVAVEKSKWSIHFDQSSYQLGTDSQAVKVNMASDTSINFTSTLSKPGDHCAFSIQAVNDGTFDAVLNQLEMSSLSAEQSKYLTYTVSYGGTNFTSTNNSLSTALNKSARSDVVVRVEYVAPTDPAELPSSDVTVNLSLKLVYNQV